MIQRGLLVLVAAMGVLGGTVADAADGSVERLYVLDCGQNTGKDQSRWSPGVNEGKAIEFSDNCAEPETTGYSTSFSSFQPGLHFQAARPWAVRKSITWRRASASAAGS